MEKIACQIALVLHENYYHEDEYLQLDETAFESDMFCFLSNLLQANDRHFGSFLLSDFDEISWRLDYYDKILQRELP